MSRESVTTDLAVLQGWPKPTKKKPWSTSAEVAAALNLTVFQITARLKGMEGRKLVYRPEAGMWGLTGLGQTERDNPSPSLVAKPKAARLASDNGSMVGPPDDSKVPRIDSKKVRWAPNPKTVDYMREQLPLLERQLAALNPKKDRAGVISLQTGIANAKEILAKAKTKGAWSHRVEFGPGANTTVYIAPDEREYIAARAFENADLIMGDTRLRLLLTSAKAKKEAKDNAEALAREEAKEAAKQAARQKRVLAAEQEAEREIDTEAERAAKVIGDEARRRKAKLQGKVRPASKPAVKAEVKRGPAKKAGGVSKAKRADNGRLHKGGDRSRKPTRRR